MILCANARLSFDERTFGWREVGYGSVGRAAPEVLELLEGELDSVPRLGKVGKMKGRSRIREKFPPVRVPLAMFRTGSDS